MNTKVTSLRELASAHARGDIGRDDYRRSRSDLIAAVLRGELKLKVNDYPPLVSGPATDTLDNTTPRARTRPPTATLPLSEGSEPAGAFEPAAREEKPAASRNWIVPAGVAAVVVVAAAVLLTRRPETVPAEVSGPPAEAPAVAMEATPAAHQEAPAVTGDGAAGRALIIEFLEDKDWSAERREAFLADWAGLAPEERDAARASVEQGQLASAIYKKLLEERALSGLGDGAGAQARERELARFAEQVGIDDPRLKLPDNTGSDAGTAAPDFRDWEPLSVSRAVPQGRTSG